MEIFFWKLGLLTSLYLYLIEEHRHQRRFVHSFSGLQSGGLRRDHHARRVHVRGCTRVSQRISDRYQGKYILMVAYLFWV